MSADNGIYILETLGSEFRVAHLQAIENIYWDDDSNSEVVNGKMYLFLEDDDF